MKKKKTISWDDGSDIWGWFQENIPYDNSMGDYNYLIGDFIVKYKLQSQFKKFMEGKNKEWQEEIDQDC